LEGKMVQKYFGKGMRWTGTAGRDHQKEADEVWRHSSMGVPFSKEYRTGRAFLYHSGGGARDENMWKGGVEEYNSAHCC